VSTSAARADRQDRAFNLSSGCQPLFANPSTQEQEALSPQVTESFTQEFETACVSTCKSMVVFA
jgi:hypothetical protein